MLHGARSFDYSRLKWFFHIISEQFGCENNVEGLCFLAARNEIYRRVMIILEGNLGENDSPWNHVLEVQLRAFGEMKYIFERVFERAFEEKMI